MIFLNLWYTRFWYTHFMKNFDIWKKIVGYTSRKYTYHFFNKFCFLRNSQYLYSWLRRVLSLCWPFYFELLLITLWYLNRIWRNIYTLRRYQMTKWRCSEPWVGGSEDRMMIPKSYWPSSRGNKLLYLCHNWLDDYDTISNTDRQTDTCCIYRRILRVMMITIP